MRTCDVERCDRKYHARGFCKSHYNIWAQQNPDLVQKHVGKEKREHEKWCSGHQEWLLKEKFGVDNSRVDGLKSMCRECLRVTTRNRKYGVNGNKFTELLVEQNHSCAVCGSPDFRGQPWHVDHDHQCCPGRESCGQCIRGILCAPCNKGLGMFSDDLDRLLAAAAYLISHSNNYNREVVPQ